MPFDVTKAALYIKKMGDRYMAFAKRPRVRVDWETREPIDLESLIEKLKQLGCNYRDVQDVITEANKYGDGYLP